MSAMRENFDILFLFKYWGWKATFIIFKRIATDSYSREYYWKDTFVKRFYRYYSCPKIGHEPVTFMDEKAKVKIFCIKCQLHFTDEEYKSEIRKFRIKNAIKETF